jgi:hypothetical protein
MNGAATRAPSQIDELPLRVIEIIGVVRHPGHADSQKSGHPLPVRKQPSLRRANRNAKAHVVGRIGEPPLNARWCTVTVLIQVDKSHPRGEPRCIIVPVDRLKQKLLYLSAMDGPQRQPRMVDNPTKQGFVEIALYRAGDDRCNAGRHRSGSE